MEWEAITALTELAGLAVVVASLIYIAIQTKQTNDHATAASEIEWINSWNNIINSWITDELTNDVVRRGFDHFNELKNSEQAIFAMRIGAMVNQWILAKKLSSRGLLSDDISEEATRVIISVLTTKGGYQYISEAAKLFPGGQDILEMLDSRRGTVPVFSEAQPWWSMQIDS